MERGSMPIDFSLDLAGVLELKIVMDGERSGTTDSSELCSLGDVGLWT